MIHGRTIAIHNRYIVHLKLGDFHKLMYGVMDDFGNFVEVK